jgi:hypothetical protein
MQRRRSKGRRRFSFDHLEFGQFANWHLATFALAAAADPWPDLLLSAEN